MQYTSTASYFQTATQITSFCYFQGRVDRSQSIFRLHWFRVRFSQSYLLAMYIVWSTPYMGYVCTSSY